MYIKIHLPVGDSLTDNNLLRATVMIQRLVDRCHRILYPAKSIRLELPNGSTINYEKESFEKYDPFLPMVTTWFI